MTSEFVVAGIVLRNGVAPSQARDKRLKEAGSSAITKEMLDSAVSCLLRENRQGVDAFEAEKKRLIDEYVNKEQFRTDFLSSLKPEIQKGLSFVHDYRQINSQISQNINAEIESRYTGDSFEDRLRKATHNEKAIYELSKFLEEKLNVAKFLLHPERLDVQEEWARFRFHGVVVKYVRIYTRRLEDKRVKVTVSGESFAEMIANPEAISVIPHTLIDNATKYSAKDSKINIDIRDVDRGVEFSVSSYGPLIRENEREKIFEAFYRGVCAQQVEEEGAGYGLYVAQLVAVHHLGTRISVEQEAKQKNKAGYWTTFAIRLPLTASVSS